MAAGSSVEETATVSSRSGTLLFWFRSGKNKVNVMQKLLINNVTHTFCYWQYELIGRHSKTNCQVYVDPVHAFYTESYINNRSRRQVNILFVPQQMVRIS